MTIYVEIAHDVFSVNESIVDTVVNSFIALEIISKECLVTNN